MSRLKKLFPVLFLLLVAWGMTGCGAQTPHAAPTRTPQLTVAATAASLPKTTPTPLPDATASPAPTPPPTSHSLSATEIYRKVSPAVAFIQTPLIGHKLGASGFLIEGGYVLTCAHVVWPFAAVRVLFPDGTLFEDAPVVGWDYLRDIAVIGPLDTDIPPLNIADGEKLSLGEEVYLVGYPGEVESRPVPTMTRGILSRKRQWEQAEMTYLQSDAAIVGGQSGGVMVDAQGQAVGLTGLRWGYQFSLADSLTDVMPLVQKIIAGEVVDGLGRKPLVRDIHGAKKITVEIENSWENKALIMWPKSGTLVKIVLDNPDDLDVKIIDSRQQPPEYVDDSSEWKSFRANGQPYIITVGNVGDSISAILLNVGDMNEEMDESEPDHAQTGKVTIQSSEPLMEIVDPDDQHDLLPVDGKPLVGAQDYRDDFDIFRVRLRKHDPIRIRVESQLMDPEVHIVSEDTPDEILAEDDDSGGVPLGFGAEVAFDPPEDGRYWIIVNAATHSNVQFGGYLLTVSSYQGGYPTPVALTPTPTPIPTEAGPMNRFIRLSSPHVSLLYPADWLPVSEDRDCFSAEYLDLDLDLFSMHCFGHGDVGVDILIDEYGEYADYSSLKQLARDILADFLYGDEKRVAAKRLKTPGGYPFLLYHYRTPDNEHWWMAVTQVNDTPIILIFYDLNRDASRKEIRAFESVVMTSLQSFDVLAEDAFLR